MLNTFYQWFESCRSILATQDVRLDIFPATVGLSPNSIHADLRSTRYEWTIQLWENGFSDSHFLDWENMAKGVETTHYDFSTEDDLLTFLEETLNRMHVKSNIEPC